MIIKMDNELKFKCPICNDSFTMQEFYDHNQIKNVDFKTFIEKKINESLKDQELEFQKELLIQKEQYEKDFLIKWSNKETELRQQIEELKIRNAENRILNSKTRGENFEIEAENELRKAFGYVDVVEKITMGNGTNEKADFLQTIKEKNNAVGKIVYEVKNAKWSNAWLPKLLTDTANQKAKYGILVASSFNEKYRGDIPFIQSDEYPNIWIANPWSFIFLAQIIRKLIIIEHDYEAKTKLLSKPNNENEIQALDKNKRQIMKLHDFLNYEMPKIMISFDKQLDDIWTVRTGILKTSDNHVAKLTKAHAMLQKTFREGIATRLEMIIDDDFNHDIKE